MKLVGAVLVVLAFLASMTWGQTSECYSGICQEIKCLPMSESDCEGVFMPRGGMCGCCSDCFKALGYGEPCSPFDPSNPPEGLCKNGYFCDNFKGKCTFLLPG